MPSIPSMNRAFAGPTNIFYCIHLNRIWLTFQPTKFTLWILNLIIEEKHIPAVTHFSCPSKIPLVMNCRIGCFDLNIRATNLRNIVCDQSSLLASQGSGFHERVDFWDQVWFLLISLALTTQRAFHIELQWLKLYRLQDQVWFLVISQSISLLEIAQAFEEFAIRQKRTIPKLSNNVN